MKFIHSARYMANLLWNLKNCKKYHRKNCRIKCKDCFLWIWNANYNLTKYKRLFCNKEYSNNIDEKSKKQTQEHI